MMLNAQGDVICLLDSTGATVASYEYDPFGNILSATGTMAEANPLRYRSYYYDRETGFYYLNSRYYDPKTGRFINADSYVSTDQGIVGYNMFAYCGNNPVNASDPMGESAAAVEWWLEEMWWLCGADIVLPIGDLAYVGGIVILGLGVFPTSNKTLKKERYREEVGDFSNVMFSKYITQYDGNDEDDDKYSGGRKRNKKSKTNTPSNNIAQNKQFNDATKGLTKAAKRRVHDRISKQGGGYHDIRAAIEELF